MHRPSHVSSGIKLFVIIKLKKKPYPFSLKLKSLEQLQLWFGFSFFLKSVLTYIVYKNAAIPFGDETQGIVCGPWNLAQFAVSMSASYVPCIFNVSNLSLIVFQTPFGLIRMTEVVVPFLYVGTLISKNFAALLEEHDIFVPEDDDDDDWANFRKINGKVFISLTLLTK